MNEPLYWMAPDGTAHERCQLFFTASGEIIPFDPGAHPALRWPRKGFAYFCPTCGDVWTRIVQIDSRGQSCAFEVVVVACARHPDSWNIPGSVLAGELEELLPLLPPGMLKQELEVHLTYLERESVDPSLIYPTGGESAADGRQSTA